MNTRIPLFAWLLLAAGLLTAATSHAGTFEEHDGGDVLFGIGKENCRFRDYTQNYGYGGRGQNLVETDPSKVRSCLCRFHEAAHQRADGTYWANFGKEHEGRCSPLPEAPAKE